MRMLLALLACVTAAAQTPGTNWLVTGLTQGGISICVTIDNPTDSVTSGRIIRTTSSTPPLDITPSRTTCAASSEDRCCIADYTLTPGTTYLMHPSTYNGSTDSAHTDAGSQTALSAGEASICGDFDGPNCNIVSDGSGNNILQIITPGDGTYSSLNPPVHDNTLGDYTITGTTVTLTVNGSGLVTDFKEALATQKAAIEADSDGEIYGIECPAGAIIRPSVDTTGDLNYVMPDFVTAKPNSHLVIFSGPTDSDADLPKGGRPDNYDMGWCSIEFNTDTPSTATLVNHATNVADNIHYQQIRFANPPFDEMNVPTVAITSATISGGKTTINYASGALADWGTLFGVRVDNLENPWFKVGFYNQQHTEDPAFWSVSATSANPLLSLYQFEDKGSSGTGIVYWPVAHEFTSATTEPQPTLTFGSDHQGSDGPEYALNDITSSVATTSTGAHSYYMPGYSAAYDITFYVEGTTGGCDGLYLGDHSTSDDTTGAIGLVSGPTGCTGGTIRQVYPVLLHHISGTTYEFMSCIVTFETTTTAKVLECYDGTTAFTPDWNSATNPTGWLSMDPNIQPPFLDLTGTTNVTCDRCIFDTGGIPWRQEEQVILGTADQAQFVGGLARTEYWQPTNPISETAHSDTRVERYTLANVFSCRYCTDLQVRNFAAETASFFFFSSNGGQVCPSDHTFEGILINTPSEYNQGSSTSGGIGRPMRQYWEYKHCAKRIKIDGLGVTGQTISSISTQYVFVSQTNTSGDESTSFVKAIEDNEITNFVVRGNLGFFMAGRVRESSVGPTLVGVNTRNWVHHGIFQDRTTRGGPSGDFLSTAGQVGNVQGLAARFNFCTECVFEDFVIAPPRSDDGFTAFLDQRNRSSMVKIRDGIVIDSGPSASGFARVRTGDSGSTWALLTAQLAADNGSTIASTSEVGNLLVLPCTPSAQNDWDFETANDPTNVENVWNVTGWNDTGRAELLTTDSTESCADRMDTVFEAGSWTSKEAYNDKGVDAEVILDAQGRIRDVVHKVTRTTINMTYTAPTSDLECKLSAAAGSGTDLGSSSSVVSVTDVPGGSAMRSVELTGLTAGTTYTYRLSCSYGATVIGEVATLPL